MVTRRSLLRALALGIVAAAIDAWPQQQARVAIVGLLMATIGPDDPAVGRLRDELRRLGYADGENIRLEFRGAQGQVDRLPRLADELVALKADVIMVGNEASLRVAKQATSTIPLVAVLWDYDPVAAGLIESFNRPGGNITGIFTRTPELTGKRLELLKEILPGLTRIAVFWDAFGQRQLDQLEPAARLLGIAVERVELRAPYDFKAAFKTAKQRKAGAVMQLFSPVFWAERTRIHEEALAAHMPVFFVVSARDGGLISYGPDPLEAWARAAHFIARLLSGTKASELPVEQSDTFKLIINEKTAKALGITIPPSLLLRADEVIR